MTTGLKAVMLLVAVRLLACPALAGIVNGSFETGDFTGWLVDELQGTAQVVAGGTDGDWAARLAPQGRYYWNGVKWVFSQGRVELWQRSVDVPLNARFLLFDAWVEGYGVGYASFPGPFDQVVIASLTPLTYAIDVCALQGQVAGRFLFEARDTDVGENYVYLDNMRFTDVPEPGSAPLLATGVLLAAMRRHGRAASGNAPRYSSGEN